MKRNLAIAAGAVALAIPAVAFGAGANTVYVGSLVGSPDSAVKLKQAKGEQGRVVKSFAVRDFGVECKGGVPGALRRVKAVGTVHVDDDGSFAAKNDDGKTVVKISGTIGRNKATGSFRYFGRIEAEDGRTRDCDSGKLTWKVRP